MYISKVELWNFRKFGKIGIPINGRLDSPDLRVEFGKGLSAIIGANDAGKTAIIDAIKIVLSTHSTEWNWLNDDDFFDGASELRIECTISGLDPNQAKNFIEWLSFDKDGQPHICIVLNATKSAGKGVVGDVKSGADKESILPAEVRSRLKAIYLKPLRDAKNELIARKNSRLSQILNGHDLFKEDASSGSTELVTHLKEANDKIRDYFRNPRKDGYTKVTKLLEDPLRAFFDSSISGLIDVGDIQRIREILEKLMLHIKDRTSPGLGSLNRLFIATELLLFLSNSSEEGSAHIALIEELEAHLHPQAQLKVAKYLQDKVDSMGAQIIITTHSPNIASQLKLDSLILCVERGETAECYRLNQGATMLEKGDYLFLERFLDVTKANLFFAKGLLIVEGDAENIIMPSLAEKIGKDFTSKSVSIVNVGSTAYLRYANIFLRPDGSAIPLKVGIVADVDVRPDKYKTVKTDSKTAEDYSPTEFQARKDGRVKIASNENIVPFVSPYWTLEYCLALSHQMRRLLYKAALLAKREEAGLFEDDQADDQQTVESEVDEFFAAHETAHSTDQEIAWDIYYEHILRPEVSKAIVAQQFSKLLLESDIRLNADDEPIAYLFDAIKHVTE